jgi:hypothetical protein
MDGGSFQSLPADSAGCRRKSSSDCGSRRNPFLQHRSRSRAPRRHSGHGQRIQVATGFVKCATINQLGTSTSSSTTTATLAPTFSCCKAFGVSATVAANGCTYVLHATPKSEEPFPLSTDIKCPAGKKIVVTPIGINCIVEVPEQLGLGSIAATNEGLAVPETSN